MCVSKVSVRDVLHPNNPYRRNWFDCGKCPACSQHRANRRASRIRNHYIQGFTPFFITLKYDNKNVPFVLKSDIIHASNMVKLFHKPYRIPIYRSNVSPLPRHDGKYFFPRKEVIDYYTLEKNITDESLFDTFGFLRVKVHTNPDIYSYVDNCVSISYFKDIQKMYNRLRQRLFRKFKSRQKISYYTASEYGPTSQRFHMHICVWLPNVLHEETVRSIFDEIWPYETRDDEARKKFCQVARDASHYLASYVNCDANVSPLLRDLFPLRHSHSLGFGFSNPYFRLSEIIGEDSSQWRFKYPFLRQLPNGKSITDYAFYPSHVIYRYFPKLKGFARLNRLALYNAYLYPAEYLKPSGSFAGPVPKRVDPFSADADLKTPRYNNLIQFDGQRHSISEYEYNLFTKRLKDCYSLYYQPLGYSYYHFVKTVVSYIIRRPLEFYKDSQSNESFRDNALSFFNLYELKHGIIHNDSLKSYVSSISDYNLNPNLYPTEVEKTARLIEQFRNNIKQRKINAL